MCRSIFRDRLRLRTLIFVLAALSWVNAQAELQPEPIPNVEKLKVPYPSSYALVYDIATEKFSLVDTKTRHLKGMLSAGQFATIDFSIERQKFYVGETVFSRGTRGTRQDIVTVYDFENLRLVGEVDLPPKRMNVVVNKSSTAITADDEFMLVFNMNPATSVTVIKLDTETVTAEIQTPGCSLVYPRADRGFFTLCGNGGLVSISLDEDGVESGRWASEVFNNIDEDPLSEKAERAGNIWYFISYAGSVQPIDASGDEPQVLPRWWLTTQDERAANWRPAGWHGKATNDDDDALLWVAMAPDGYNGSHKDPASEVWLFSAKAGNRLARIQLKVPAMSITASAGPQPQLLVVNTEGSLDVYDGRSGDYVHSIHVLGQAPYMVHALY